ncbi:metal-dependent transcriptional regulator [Brachybacterium hainanense]|uniref:Manganese transport regulator n=1 Tax=Brachybacterium hainanense TaxID=1541174 RepID=A0ABV6R6R8_9MICO
MPADRPSAMVQDYLKVIWSAQEWDGGSISTSAIAERLGVAPSSVSGNLKRLARDGLIEYEPYGAIELSDSGRCEALRMVRRHRLLEAFLVERLGYTWDEVHEEADQLEHAISDRLLARMDADLGHPAADPHGDPIPGPDGSVSRPESHRLSDLARGRCGLVVRISDRDPELLRYLDARGIGLGTHLRIDARSEGAGVLAVSWEAGDEHRALDLSLVAAEAMRIAPDGHAPAA